MAATIHIWWQRYFQISHHHRQAIIRDRPTAEELGLVETDSRRRLPAAHPDGKTRLVHLLEERLLAILHCFLCCCPLLSFIVCICWCLTILSFLVTAFVLSVLYVMSRDIKHLKRNDGYESDNSNNPGDWREWSDRDVDTPRPLPLSKMSSWQDF